MSNIFSIGRPAAPIVVVTDWSHPSAGRKGQLMSDDHMNFFMARMKEAGIGRRDCVFINPCPMNPAWMGKKPPTEKNYGIHVDEYQEEFRAKLATLTKEAKVIIGLGKSAGRQLFGKAVKITKVRGSFGTSPLSKCPVMMTLSPAHALSRPEVQRDMDTDLRMVGQMQRGGWKGGIASKVEGNYKVCTDLSDWLKDPPRNLCVDTETTGLQWAGAASILCIQLTAEAGVSRVIPVNGKLFGHVPFGDRRNVTSQLRKLLAMPQVRVFGHNFKYDLHMLSKHRIEVATFWLDTLQMVFSVDENMMSKSLKEAVRRWVPSMAGYSDEFDAAHDKGRLIEAEWEDVVKYGGGDTDANFQLREALRDELKGDAKQMRTLTRVQMPALRMFYRMEKQGMSVDTRKLRDLGIVMNDRAFELETQLLKMIPKKVKQKHFDHGLSFGRKAFLQDILFSRDGFNLKVYSRVADGTPSTDAIHLSSHASHPFVAAFKEFQQVNKMRTTYVGTESATIAQEIKLLKNGGWPVAIRRITNHEPEDLQH